MPRRECANNHWHGWCGEWLAVVQRATWQGLWKLQCTILSTVSFFFFFNCKTFLFVQNKLSHKSWSCCKLLQRYVWVLIPPTPTEILQDMQVQRHVKCVHAEQLCCKNPNGKPRQTSRECEGQNGFLCVSLLLLPHTPTTSTLSLWAQTDL